MPVPIVPAMARPAIPANAISLSVLPEPDSAAAAAGAPGGSAGSVTAIGRTAGVATVQLGGTDNAPDGVRLGQTGRELRCRQAARAQIQQGRREWLHRRGPLARPGLFPIPAADDLVGVGTGQGADDVEGKGDDPEAAQWDVGCERRQTGRQVDEDRDQVADRAQWVAGGESRRPAAALCSALGIAEKACWMVLCALPAAVPVAWLAAAD